MTRLLEALRWAALSAVLISCVGWLVDYPVSSVVCAGVGAGLWVLRSWLHATRVVNEARDEVGGRHREPSHPFKKAGTTP